MTIRVTMKMETGFILTLAGFMFFLAFVNALASDWQSPEVGTCFLFGCLGLIVWAIYRKRWVQ